MLATESRHSSESVEHFTPSNIVEAARKVLGKIDLDPASCEDANRVVRAERFYTKEDDGFIKPWFDKVFLNPPGGKVGNDSNQKRWWFKLCREWTLTRTSAAVFICFSVELLQTTQVKTPEGLKLPLDFPICFPSRRIAYMKPGGARGGSPPHSSCIVFLPGCDATVDKFRESFGGIGKCINV